MAGFECSAQFAPSSSLAWRPSLLAGLAGLVYSLGAIAMAFAVGDAWSIWFAGFIALFAGLLVFGIAAWRTEALGRWRFLPIVPGLLLPATFGIGVELAVQVIVMLLAASLILLGYVVQRPATRQAAATV